MFSAAKACWLLDCHDPARARTRAGRVCLGTIDTYLMNRLGAGAVTEAGNASRTQLLDVHRQVWDADLLSLFDVPLAGMPELMPSIGPRGDGAALHPRLAGTAVHAVLGDSHAALFGHGAFRSGDGKVTLGTGSSVMALAPAPVAADSGICSTIAWDLGAGPSWALEGNIRCAGATVQWLADVLQVTPDELAQLAWHHDEKAGQTVLVPAFGGLGAPWWDARAVGLIAGLTLGTSRADLMHAAIDSIAHQVTDVVEAMDRCVDRIVRLRVDGGPTRNPHLRALLAGYLGRPVMHLDEPQVSALGVAHMAGLSLGLWTLDALGKLPRPVFASTPDLPAERVRARRQAWSDGLRRSRLPGDSWR
jgi:glycerol kinase